jgi:hypothetical protein
VPPGPKCALGLALERSNSLRLEMPEVGLVKNRPKGRRALLGQAGRFGSAASRYSGGAVAGGGVTSDAMASDCRQGGGGDGITAPALPSNCSMISRMPRPTPRIAAPRSTFSHRP